ncbi:MAG: carotenoid biosynthesis protein [Microbacter sp.]
MTLNISRLQLFFEQRKRQVIVFYIIFYTVGVVGMLVPAWFPFFLQLVPWALMLSFVGLLLFHSRHGYRKSLAVFAGLYLLGFFIEVVGVNSGAVFGKYQYENTLGLQLFHTPLMIGINWIFLSYTAVSMMQNVTKNVLVQMVGAPLVMLGYDLVLEPMAPIMKMWRWDGSMVPLQNYIAWWIIGFLFVAIYKAFRIETKNKMAFVLFCCQFFFFVVLFIRFKWLS